MPIQVIPAERFDTALPALSEILADCVNGGASVNFVLPFDAAGGRAFFERIRPAVEAGTIVLFGAYEEGRLLGTVQLALPHQPNQRHRADIAKLLVSREARGKGMGRALMAAAEDEARRRGLSLLVLDTETESTADGLYRSLGWTAIGTVPRYASNPAGELRDCTFFYKELV